MVVAASRLSSMMNDAAAYFACCRRRQAGNLCWSVAHRKGDDEGAAGAGSIAVRRDFAVVHLNETRARASPMPRPP
jgi:hypothetical protein